MYLTYISPEIRLTRGTSGRFASEQDVMYLTYISPEVRFYRTRGTSGTFASEQEFLPRANHEYSRERGILPRDLYDPVYFEPVCPSAAALTQPR